MNYGHRLANRGPSRCELLSSSGPAASAGPGPSPLADQVSSEKFPTRLRSQTRVFRFNHDLVKFHRSA
jgi:hypothetical protein